MNKVKQNYEERIKRLNIAFDKKTPDRVPILSMSETWHLHLSKANIFEAFTKNSDLYFEAFKNYYEEYYCDGQHSLGNIFPIKMIEALGSGGSYVVTDDSLQIVGSKAEVMKVDEYKMLIEDPIRFVATQIAPRKYERLNGSPEATYDALCKACDEFKKFAALNGTVVKRVNEELGVPILTRAACYVTPDIVLDHLRDFVGTINDIRRHPNEFLKACESLFDWTIRLVTDFYKTPEDGGFIFSPLHLPTYLKPKDFEKFYLPFLLKMSKALSEKGYTQFLFMENDWLPYLDMLNDLPDAKIVGLFEHGNFKEIKKKIGHKMSIAGGMPTNLLNYKSKKECIDYAKMLLDEVAPGGGYIFSIDRSLMALADCNPENYKAVVDYVKENGIY